MNPEVEIRDNLGWFIALEKAGVQNLFTLGNQYWGNMSFKNRPNNGKYAELLQLLDPGANWIAFQGVESVDGINILTEENLAVYKVIQKDPDFNCEGVEAFKVTCDALITKERIPIFICPADCAVVLLTGVDQKDQKRFIAIVHSGLTGSLLNVVGKCIKQLQYEYKFDVSELEAFIYPYIFGKNYIRPKGYVTIAEEIKDVSLSEFTTEVGDMVQFDFVSKIKKDLESAGVGQVFDCQINTYEENEKGMLFSQSYAKEHSQDPTARFSVGFCIR